MKPAGQFNARPQTQRTADCGTVKGPLRPSSARSLGASQCASDWPKVFAPVSGTANQLKERYRVRCNRRLPTESITTRKARANQPTLSTIQNQG